MTPEEIRIRAKKLAEDIQALAHAFERETDTFIHSIPVIQRPGGLPITVDVKVQLTAPR